MKNDIPFWIENNDNKRDFRTSDEDIECEVCIIGGGITGISTAYYLSKAGVDVALIEKDYLASKTTGRSTAKITSQHNLFYNYLINSKSKDFAKKYLEANEKAIENIKNIVFEENIDCDFEVKDSVVFTNEVGKLNMINDEISALKQLNFKADLVDEIEVLGKIEGGVKFPKQACFNPVKYVEKLAECVLKNGGNIYEHTKALDYEKDNDGFIINIIANDKKRKIKAKYIVVATRYPIFNIPGFHFLKMYQELEYGIAIKSDKKLKGMYVSVEVPRVSFRSVTNNGENYIFIVGNGNKTGDEANNTGFEFLEKFAQKYFNINADDIMYRWNAEDTITLDKIPYIGNYSEVRKNMYVATGYNKWGMTSSNIAANIITDKILQNENKYENIFDSTRFEPMKNREEVENMLKEVGKSIIMPRLRGEERKKYCSHLGCEVKWNHVTETWDCPCHGSRYTREGKVIDGPSVYDLNEK